MELSNLKIVLALIILIMAVIGGLPPFWKRRDSVASALDFPRGEALAAGIFLGAGLLHMLPDAVNSFIQAGHDYRIPFLIAALSFLLLLCLEHIAHSLKNSATLFTSSMALLTVVILTIHSLMEGAAVGVAENIAATSLLFFAIIAHKGAASFALSITLNKSQLTLIARIVLFSVFAIATPISVIGGSMVLSDQHVPLLAPIFSSLAAGTFFYIGTLHGLDRSILIRRCCNLREFLLMLLGFAVMAAVMFWV